MKSMKLWLTATVFALFFAAMPMMTSTADAGQRGDDFLDAFTLNLNLEFCWDGYSCGNTGLYLNLNKTFTTGDGGTGYWTYDRSTTELKFIFTTGCFPIYQGTKSAPRTWAGTMACQDGSGSGTWNAVFTGISRADGVSNPTAGASAGPPAE